MKLLRNPKSALYLVAAFVILLLMLFAMRARGSELQLEGGSAVIRGYTPTIGLSIQWPDKGPVGTDYELGFMLIGDGDYNGVEFSNQVGWYAMLWDGYRAVELGIGAAYFNVESPFTCQTTFALGARWRITKRIATQWRHFSTGGSCQPNSGRDIASVAFRF
jgi:Lipid A 3-O-deacylase (PagL)